MNPYEQHRQNQFHAPLSETNCTFTFEPTVIISESSARAIVAAIDDNRPHRAAHLIKELPWFPEILSGVRATRHLRPENYITLPDRSSQLLPS